MYIGWIIKMLIIDCGRIQKAYVNKFILIVQKEIIHIE